jgi:hypothetical protein
MLTEGSTRLVSQDLVAVTPNKAKDAVAVEKAARAKKAGELAAKAAEAAEAAVAWAAEAAAAAAAEAEAVEAEEEQQIDSVDGNAYTKADFVDAYRGTAEWDAAGAAEEEVSAAEAAGPASDLESLESLESLIGVAGVVSFGLPEDFLSPRSVRQADAGAPL